MYINTLENEVSDVIFYKSNYCFPKESHAVLSF